MSNGRARHGKLLGRTDVADGRNSELWAFMLAVYARPGVADACLRLQEAHGLDVILLLTVLHGGVTGHVADPQQIQDLEQDCSEWRKTVVHPLRKARRAMKQHVWLKQHAKGQVLRERVKAAELDAERIQASFGEEKVLGIQMSSALENAEKLGTLADMVLDLYDLYRPVRLSEDVLTIVNGVLGAWGAGREPA